MIISGLLNEIGTVLSKDRMEDLADNLNIKLGAAGRPSLQPEYEGVVMISAEWAVAVEYTDDESWEEIWKQQHQDEYAWPLLQSGLSKLERVNQGFLFQQQRRVTRKNAVVRELINGPPIIVNTGEKTVFYDSGVGCTVCGEPATGVYVPLYGEPLRKGAYSEGIPSCESHFDEWNNPQFQFRQFND